MKKSTTIIFALLLSSMVFAQPKLSSYPTAKATIFLDFDGQFVQATPWNGGKSFYCEPANLSDAQVTEIFQRVSEDFRPFEINITTDSSVYLAAPLVQRVRVIVTPTSSWYQGVGGVSFTRSFTWGDGTPAFVFPDRLAWNTKAIAECCSHESGHTLGLSHQAKYNEDCSLITVYNDGIGSGQTAWAPVMGNSYGRNLSGWNNGPTPSGCTADQDNLSIITGINGFSYRIDDHSDHPESGATQVVINSENKFNADGIITTSNDKDVFELNFDKQGYFSLNAKPFSVGPSNTGANLDLKIVVMDKAYNIINTYDPQEKLDVSIDTLLNPGKYFVIVSGAGNQFTSNYGSLGSYSFEGNFMPLSALPISRLDLKGIQYHDKHRLSWDLICDEGIREQDIQVSYNGKDFQELASLSASKRDFESTPLAGGDIFYRIKITTETGSISYSNIAVIKGSVAGKNIMSLKSNMIKDNIEINSHEPFNYILADMNGKILRKGNEPAGFSVINISNSPNGIYIIQMISNSQKLTQRIVRL